MLQSLRPFGLTLDAAVRAPKEVLTGKWAKSQPTVMQRLGVERVAGELMALAA